ncbi:MAG: trypsin-like peptidase domain-containing protein [Rhodocyclaceae bacterium]|nr:trypsin-like peptidase domain-containing protein [Rhodocyclaceae bacterium]MBL0074544.1 trypsin-like peptidase domain-containing protein [Rhodocyclaceae bacterium]MBP6109157.1 trypsin-like peptidase domain-containing protein [Rhodocyclaceae bacterium]MBP6278938.1 trypsin-like peptidase domain-containing protein [Rhodocyclaceae bacterium]
MNLLFVRSLLYAVAMAILPMPIQAATLSVKLQQQVRAATFEVVISKANKDPLSYEKPLPMELVPFAERNDRYWSIGTAVAIGANTFVTASHVISVGAGSQLGAPALRDGNGKVYMIDRILKFSLPEDYVVFSVIDPPTTARALPVSKTLAIDVPVFAVGNALGEGVVIRDGLLTSLTPEARDGRWKWLRFSAAASPGNSGGPLLDSRGRVVGIVIAKSPNENLNYALPIERVLGGSEKAALIEIREPFGLPILQDTTVMDFKSAFPLPASYAEFSKQFLALNLQYYESQVAQLLAEQSDKIFPKGETASFFAGTFKRYDPTLVTQKDDKSWELLDTSNDHETKLPGNGRVWNTLGPRMTLFRVQYPEASSDVDRYSDSKGFMDILAKGLRLSRLVGAQSIRITSLGDATQATTLRDTYQRVWQVRSWSFGFVDLQVIVFALPTPDGYVGMAAQSGPAQISVVTQQMKLLADYFFVSYTGTLPQWRTYLARNELRAGAFDQTSLDFDYAKGLNFHTKRLRLDLPNDIVRLGDKTVLNVRMAYLPDGDKLSWEPVSVRVSQEVDEKTSILASRQPKPAEGATKELQSRWDQMLTRTGDFAGGPRHSDDFRELWFRTVVGPTVADKPASLYEVTYSTEEALLPRQLDERRARVLNSISILEH